MESRLYSVHVHFYFLSRTRRVKEKDSKLTRSNRLTAFSVGRHCERRNFSPKCRSQLSGVFFILVGSFLFEEFKQQKQVNGRPQNRKKDKGCKLEKR